MHYPLYRRSVSDRFNIRTLNAVITLKSFSQFAHGIFFEVKLSRVLLAVHSQCHYDKIYQRERTPQKE